MGKYCCEKCGKEFSQKPHYTKHMNQYFPKPILKWVGGKTQIVDKLLTEFPTVIHNYHEVFLGGGSVLFALLSHIKRELITIHGDIYAYDINEPLIYLYKNIQTNHIELYHKIQDFIDEYNSSTGGELNRKPNTIEEAKQCKENYYYWIRFKYNALSSLEKNAIIGSAMFLFLNKTCFRGMFRVGPNGFNVPYGHYANPEIVNKEHLEEIHHLIQGVRFQCCDFTVSLLNIQEGDYVYLDPPYVPENATSFVGYTENGFTLEQHTTLFELCHSLTRENKKMMMSNADVSMVRQHFTEDSYKIHSIVCRRAIHSQNPDATANEVIIQNYGMS